MTTDIAPPSTTESRLRRMLLALLTFGLLGIAFELWSFGHFEDANQMIPFVTIAASIVTIVWQAVAPGRVSLRLFQLAMLAWR